ncbi:MAG: cytochrome c biogenesis protein ResB [Propionibacteriaceae bacterium]|nr:cytochrome c biogenesis protein ResB [Propionibacteriaceae bacterium]
MRTVVELARWSWAQLTSMRTALFLLFLLAVAAIPGSMIPQRSVSPINVLDFKQAHPELDRFYEPLGFYEVYSSPWFSAIYLLLFVSLVGCILPRIGVYARAVRTPPPKIPKRLDRLPAYARADAADPDLGLAERWLRQRRFRVVTTADGVAAERGYLREAGNIVFHLGLVFILAGVAWSNLAGFRGSAVIVEGQGFSNNITQYDDLSAGGLVDTERLRPFTVKLNRFIAEFETGEVQRGAARRFEAHVEVTDGGEHRGETIEVNHPLDLGGTKVHLIGHGYAAHVTVKDGAGEVAFSGPVVFLPQDGNFTSSGVIKVPDARPQRLAFEGLFLPTATIDMRGPHSLFPDAYAVELFVNAWHGDPKAETGRPENVYTLDTAGLAPVTQPDGTPLRVQLKPGQGFDLPNGLGSVSFDGWSRWVKLQISDTPGIPLALAALAAAITGICLSLFIRPRRLWVRRTDTGIEAGGLDRADASVGLDEDVAALAALFQTGAPERGNVTAVEQSAGMGGVRTDEEAESAR